MLLVVEFVSDSYAEKTFHAKTLLDEACDTVVANLDAQSGLPSEAAVLVGQVHFVQRWLEFLEAIAPKTDACPKFGIKHEMLQADAVELEMPHDAMARLVEVGYHGVETVAVMIIVDFSRVETIGAAQAYDLVEIVSVGAINSPNLVHPTVKSGNTVDRNACHGMEPIADADFVPTKVLHRFLFFLLRQGRQT